MLKSRHLNLILFFISLLLLKEDLYSQQQKDTISFPRLSKFTVASINKYHYSQYFVKLLSGNSAMI